MKNSVLRVMTVLIVWLGICSGNAFGYSSIVVFGDSLSDNGNVARFTNGPLWVELLADHFSANLYDFAYGGATTGYDNPAIGSSVTGLLWQVDTYSPFVAGLPTNDTLLTVWAGANDFLQGRGYEAAAANIATALEGLYTAGGRNFLVPNLPDIGKTPALVSLGPTASAGASAWTGAFDAELVAMLQSFSGLHSDITLYLIDVFSIFNQYAVGSPEWRSLFWVDGFHPSSIGHELIYQAAAATVPEPGALLLFAIGLMGITGLKRRIRAERE